MKWFFFSVMGFSLYTQAWANTEHCPNAITQLELTQCATDFYKTEDAQMNEAYLALYNRLNTQNPVQQQLLTAQNAWLAFRDADCELRAKIYEGGSLRQMAVQLCLGQRTQERRLALQTLFEEINR
jgi:uncharacterized protein YecT (DUF1311 family)